MERDPDMAAAAKAGDFGNERGSDVGWDRGADAVEVDLGFDEAPGDEHDG
jgi:hypothetical protein